MEIKDFQDKYGELEQKVTKNFVSKSLAVNYSVEDAFKEFCDNAWDSRLNGQKMTIEIVYNKTMQTLIFRDNGSGIVDPDNLFTLGGTDKEANPQKIGKYGIGVPGATSAIAKRCRANKESLVIVEYMSAINGKMFSQHVAYEPTGSCVIGHVCWKECVENKHFTQVSFANVKLNDINEIIESLKKTFEESFAKGLDITFNGKSIKTTVVKTFVGDESVETVNVGNIPVDVKYRIIGGANANAFEKTFDNAGLRIYDKYSGRLLAISNDLWSWYANRIAQPTICGLRAAIYIESSIDSYNLFGIKSAKNGVTYCKYYKKPEFADLSEKLGEIYCAAANTRKKPVSESDFTFGNRTYHVPANSKKIVGLYDDANPEYILIKEKYTAKEVAPLIDMYIKYLNKKKNNE